MLFHRLLYNNWLVSGSRNNLESIPVKFLIQCWVAVGQLMTQMSLRTKCNLLTGSYKEEPWIKTGWANWILCNFASISWFFCWSAIILIMKQFGYWPFSCLGILLSFRMMVKILFFSNLVIFGPYFLSLLDWRSSLSPKAVPCVWPML